MTNLIITLRHPSSLRASACIQYRRNAKHRLEILVADTCPECQGYGGDECPCCGQWVECPHCNGIGRAEKWVSAREYRELNPFHPGRISTERQESLLRDRYGTCRPGSIRDYWGAAQ